ncbi:YceI family protein [Shimia sagamensis]|uniref:Polyisoprenoid-binding protein YceI n=1 Tax=Shimia sagamensis TaxID=1566352 RepID=A0ABY1NJP9_9RHOB|nr:YceI family protein [Shimia sagamensis]SMP11537.1 Polyisoprenoid-binding protein YceI [Shimia sagamensis]
MKRTLLAAGLAFAAASATPAFAAPEKYMLDSGHSQILFSYNHLGYSTTWGLFSGFEGEIMFDQEDPANSSVAVSMPVQSMWTGWEKRDAHLMSPDFFDASDDEMVSFTSTGIEVTGETTANITGDLTINGVTKSVVLDAQLNTASEHPMAKKPWAGFNATTTLKRTEFDVGNFAPFVSDEVTVQISVEAMKAE